MNHGHTYVACMYQCHACRAPMMMMIFYFLLQKRQIGSGSDMNRHEGRTRRTAEAESGRGPTVFAHPLRAKALVLSPPVRPGRTAECPGAAQPAPCLGNPSVGDPRSCQSAGFITRQFKYVTPKRPGRRSDEEGRQRAGGS
jgi:hypothetical protein